MDRQASRDATEPPGDLRLVLEFLRAPIAHPSPRDMADAAAIRRRHAEGASQAALARDFGYSRGWVSAILGDRVLTEEHAAEPGLMSIESARDWLMARGLLDRSGTLAEDSLLRLHELRELLKAMTMANNGKSLPDDVLQRLDEMAAEAPSAARFGDPGGPALTPAPGADPALARLIAIVYTAMREGTWQRLKWCAGDGCLGLFYDPTRNRTRTWCDMAVCGNRAKVRNYQRRRRASAGRE